MRCMFTMMNNARLAVGLEGLASPSAPTSRPSPTPASACQGRRDGEAGADHRASRRAPDAAHDEGPDRGHARPGLLDRRPRSTGAERHPDADRARPRRRAGRAADPDGQGVVHRPRRRDRRRSASRSTAAWATSRRPASPSTCATPASRRSTRAPTASRPWTSSAASCDRRWRAALAPARGAARRAAEAARRSRAAARRPPWRRSSAATRHLQDSPPDDRAAGAVALSAPVRRHAGRLSARAGRSRGGRVPTGPALARFYVTSLLPSALALEGPAMAGVASLDAPLPAG